jgi:hypothetical protein
MTHVEGFDSMDEAFMAMDVMEDIANLDLTPAQIALRDDVENTRHWAQALPDIDLVIYGIVPPVADIMAKDPGFNVVENRARGYLTGTAYSADDERGDPHDMHVSQVIPISGKTFMLAKGLKWPTFSMLLERENRELGRRLAEHEREARPS